MRFDTVTLAKCWECPLNEYPLVPGFGKKYLQPDIAFVAEAPGETEVEEGRPLVGKSGKFLRMVMGDLGIYEDQCYFTNICLCRPPGNAVPNALAAKACRTRLVTELAQVRPKLIVTLGKTPAQYLVGNRAAIGRSHGFYRELELRPPRITGIEPYSVGVVPTYHPSGVMRTPEYFRDFVDELKYAKSIVDGQPPIVEPPYENYVTIGTQAEFLWFLGELKQHTLVAVDLETSTSDWFTSRITCAGFSWEREHAWIVDWPELLEQNIVNLRLLDDALSHVALAFHNGVYDIPFLLHAGLHNVNYYLDTLCAHFLLDERQGIHGLERLAAYYYRAPDYKQQFRDSLGIKGYVSDTDFAVAVAGAADEDLFAYNGADTDYTYRLAIDLVEKVKAEGQLVVLRDIEMPAARAFAEFAMTGMLVDRDYLEKMGREWSEEERTLGEQMIEMVGDPKFNPGSTKQLARYMYDTLKLTPFGGAPKPGLIKIDESDIARDILTVTDDPEAREYWTSRRTTMSSSMKGFGAVKGLVPRTTSSYMLYWLRQQHEFPNMVLKWRYARKRRSMYYTGLKKFLYADGRIRPHYVLTAAVTGRKATSRPSIHNLPRGDIVYNIFIPEPGWCLIHADYAQAELRMMAHYSGDEMLVHLLNTTDIHTRMAMQMFHLTEEDIAKMSKDELSDKRIAAKMVTFGVPYGRSASGLAPQLGISKEEAQAYLDDYFELVPKLKEWIAQQRALGIKDQLVTNIFGRRRRFPLISDQFHRREVERMAGNFPIQSGINDLTLLAYTHALAAMRAEGIPVKPGPHIHDSINYSVPKPLWRTAVEAVAASMSDIPFKTTVGFFADVEVGERWGKMFPVHKKGQWIDLNYEDPELPEWVKT